MSEYNTRGSSEAETRPTSGEPGYSYQNEPSVREEYSSESQDMKSKVQDQASKLQDQAQEYGEKAQEQLDAGKDQAASGMKKAADVLRDKTGQSSGMTAQAGTKVADTMESAAGYLREHDTAQMWDDLEAYVREHPAQALAGAAFAGFLFGRILR